MNGSFKLAKTISIYSSQRIIGVEKSVKRAFTLAETLITLTIIGVIAALTIPTLYSNYQKHTWVTGLKKAYAEIQYAMKMIPITENCSVGDLDCAGWNKLNTEEFTDLNEQRIYLISKQLKIQKYCGKNNLNRCLSDEMYFSGEEEQAIGGAFVMDDGMVFRSTYGVHVNSSDMYIDVNGPKGPNKAGRDIFAISVACKDCNYNVPEGTPIPRGAKIDAGRGYWKSQNKCVTYNASASYEDLLFCTGRVLEEDAMNY